METINIKIKQKLESYQELYDSNQKTIYIHKIEDIVRNTSIITAKKDLIADFLKIVEIEN
jgi:DNA mismatch repair protein MutS2